jgi:hypothetical protein
MQDGDTFLHADTIPVFADSDVTGSLMLAYNSLPRALIPAPV